MKLFKSLWYSLRALVWRQRVDRELDEELAFHLERETALYEARGLSPRAARREALRTFGGVQRYREECRDVRRTHVLDDARADARFAFRLLRRDPAFGINVIVIAALGICACATTFSLVSGILVAPLPFPQPDRVAELEFETTEGASAIVPVNVYHRIAAGSPVFEAIGAFEPGSGAAIIGGEPERVPGRRVTPSFFRVFHVRPVIGRFFTEAEAESGALVVVLGHAAWVDRFGGDAGVIGRRVRLDGADHTIVGVMAPKFRAHASEEPMFWRPLTVTPTTARGSVNAMVRIRDGVTKRQAETWLAAGFREKLESQQASTDSLPAVGVLEPITSLIYGTVERPLLVLLGAVLLVLLLVAANIATMFLARSVARERELGVRRAMGASAGREVRQLVTESVTLTACGGALGVLASIWTVGLVRALGSRILPRTDDVALDWRVLTFAVAAVVFTGVVGGLAPTWAARRRAFGVGLSSGGDRATGSPVFTSGLVVAQVALSVVLLVGAGLLVKGFLKIAPANAGFALDNRATLSVQIPRSTTSSANPFAARQFIEAASARLTAVDGVRDVAAAWLLPFTGTTATGDVIVPGRPSDGTRLRASRNIVTPNYFDVMGIPLRAGRMFSASDDASAEPVAIVNETAAARWWPGQNPLGRQLTLPDRGAPITVRVVGVVGDVRMYGNDTRLRPEVALPIAQGAPAIITLVVRTSVEPRTISRALQRALWTLAPTSPIGATDIETITAGAVRRPRFFSTAMSLFASTAVVLGALAVYGSLAFAVVRRRKELGIRIALGAPIGRIGGMVLGRALNIGVVGVAIGLVLARALSRYMESLLIETSAADAHVFALSATGVLVLALLAACAPAYRAIRTDPIESLRT